MSLYEKIYNIMNESEGLEKDLVVGTGTNSYKAVGEKEVLNMLKPLFKKYKLIVFPVDGSISETNSSWESEYNGKKETKTRNVTLLRASFKIVDIETGESELLVGFGNGADSQDKGSGKAFTYAFKTMLSKTFMLFSGEDADNEHSDEIGKKPQTTAQSNKPIPTPQKQIKNVDRNIAAMNGDLSTEKATKAQCTALYKYALNEKGWTKEQYQTFIDDLFEEGAISSKYSKKYGTDDIIWTVDDVTTIQNQLELPF